MPSSAVDRKVDQHSSVHPGKRRPRAVPQLAGGQQGRRGPGIESVAPPSRMFVERVGDSGGFLGVGTLKRLLPSKARGSFHDYGPRMASRVVAEALAAQAAQEARLEAAANTRANAAQATPPLAGENVRLDGANSQQQEAPVDGAWRPSTGVRDDSSSSSVGKIGTLAGAGFARTAPEMRRPLLEPMPHGRTVAASPTYHASSNGSAPDENFGSAVEGRSDSSSPNNGSSVGANGSSATAAPPVVQVPEAWAHTNSVLAPETSEEETPTARHENLTSGDDNGKLVRNGSADQSNLPAERWAEPSNGHGAHAKDRADELPMNHLASSAPLPTNLPSLSAPSSLIPMGGGDGGSINNPRSLLSTAQNSERVRFERATSANRKPQLLLGRSGGLLLDGFQSKSNNRSSSRRGGRRATASLQAFEQEVATAGRVAATEAGWAFSELTASKLEDAVAAAVDEQRRVRANATVSSLSADSEAIPAFDSGAAAAAAETTVLLEQASLEAATDTTVAAAARVLGATFVAEAVAAAAAASEEAEEAAVAAAAAEEEMNSSPDAKGRRVPAQRSQSQNRKKRPRLNERVLSPEPRALLAQPQQRGRRQPLPEVRPPPRGNLHHSNNRNTKNASNYSPSAVVDAGAEALAEARAAVVALRPSQAAVLAAARTHVQTDTSNVAGNARNAMSSCNTRSGGGRRGGGAEKLARDEKLEAAAQALALRWAQAWTGPRLKALVARVSRRKEAQAFQALKWAVSWHATCNAVRSFQRCRAARACGLVFIRLLDRHCEALFRRWQLAVERIGLAEAHKAAAKGPQALSRSFLARCRMKTKAKNAAACEIQRLLVRGPQGRRKARAQAVWRHRKAAAACIERCYTVRLRQRRQRQAARAKQILNAVNALQGFLRSGLARAERRQAAIEFERYQAATKIQTLQRQRAATASVQNIRRARLMHAAVHKVQQMVRMMVAKYSLAAKKETQGAARVIQQSWKKRGPEVRARREARHQAAVVLQARHRGSLDRAKVAKKKKHQQNWVEPTEEAKQQSAKVLSRAMRRRGTQTKVAKQKSAAASIQKLGRRCSAQKAVAAKKLAVKKEKSSVAIQSRVRKRQAQKRHSKAKAARQAAFFLALALQCKYRVLEARRAVKLRQYLNERAHHEDRAVTIECAIRCYLARRHVQSLREARAALIYEQALEQAVTWAQRRARAVAARRRFRRAALAIEARRQELRLAGALLAQAMARGLLARREVRALRDQRNRAAAAWLLCRVGRGMLGRMAARKSRAEAAHAAFVENMRQSGATFLQAWARGALCRWWVLPLLAAKRAADAASYHDRVYNAATKIQCMVRRFFARKRLAQRQAVAAAMRRDLKRDAALEAELNALQVALEQNLFVVRMQCFVRRIGARGKVVAARAAREKWILEHALRRRNKSASKIQAVCRGRNVRKFMPALRAAAGAARSSAALVHAPDASLVQRSSRPSSSARRSHIHDRSNAQGFEKLYDDSAQAWYWYSAATGEAVWTDPALEL